MVMKLLVAGAIGAALLTLLQGGMALGNTSGCSAGITSSLLAGFGVGAGVQAGVMLLGVS